MKRLQIMIDEDLDAELARRAASERTSKAAIIRALVRAQLKPLPPMSADPLARMVGADEFDPVPVNDIVYG